MHEEVLNSISSSHSQGSPTNIKTVDLDTLPERYPITAEEAEDYTVSRGGARSYTNIYVGCPYDRFSAVQDFLWSHGIMSEGGSSDLGYSNLSVDSGKTDKAKKLLKDFAAAHPEFKLHFR